MKQIKMKTVFCALALALALGARANADERVLYRWTLGDKAKTQMAGGFRAAEGGTVLHKDLAGFGTCRLLDFPDLAGKNFSIRFRAREFDVAGRGSFGGHWGFTGRNSFGDQVLFYSHVSGFHTLVKSQSGQEISSQHDKSGERIARVGADGSNSNAWSEVRVAFTAAGYRLYVNGKLSRAFAQPCLPMKGLFFHCFERVLEIADFRIVEDDVTAAAHREAPTFVHPGVVTTQRVFAVDRPVSSSAGGISFWSKYVPGSPCVRFLNAKGEVIADFNYCGDLRVHAEFAIEGSKSRLYYRRRIYEELPRRSFEDIHYAFSWDETGHVRFYLNGLPFYTQPLVREDIAMPILGNRLDEVTQIVFPEQKPWEKDRQQVSDVKVFARPLRNAEVLADFWSRQPVDLVIREALYETGRPESVALTLAPGGALMRPHPSPATPHNRATVDLSFVVDRVVSGEKRVYEPVTNATTEVRGLVVDGEKTVRLNPVAYATPGTYRIRATIKNGAAPAAVRSLFFTVMDPVPAPPAPSDEKWTKTEKLFTRTFGQKADMPYASPCGVSVVKSATCGTYLECGPKGGLDADRMACILDFPTNTFGKPCLLAITWPDDKPRGIALTMHPEAKPRYMTHRDRLMQGIVAGDKYRNQMKLRTTEYLFFPETTNYLFEVRSLFEGRPGAVASITAWRLADEFPRLKVHHPEGLPFRRYGHQDEDQTFDLLLNNRHHGSTGGTLPETFRYFGYTGYSTFQYSAVRYETSFEAVMGNMGPGLFPSKAGEFIPVARAFNDRGIEFVAQFCLYDIPDIARFRQIDSDWRARGFLTLDCDGHDRSGMAQGDFTANIANPELQDLYFASFGDFLARGYAAGAFPAVQIPVSLLGKWRGPEFGYDDWTVRAFAQDYLKSVRGTPVFKRDGKLLKPIVAPAKAPADYQARYTLLWKGALKPAWVKWRADRVTLFFTRLAEYVQRRCPGIKVYLSLQTGADDYERYGMDNNALLKIPGVRLSLGRGFNGCWWELYRNKTRVDEAFSRQYDPALPTLTNLLAQAGSVELFRSGQAYFETFRNSLLPERFATYFQSLDAKPVGRDYLKEAAFGVGACDALEMTIGDQQVESFGVEDEVREFVKAYSALPAQPFAEMPGSDKARVVGRSCPTKNGTYFYLVNMTDGPQTATVDYADGKGWFGRLPEVLDLSTDESSRTDRFILKPYELRSFLVPDREFAFGTLR